MSENTKSAPRGGHDYLPGFSHDALLPLYDLVQRLFGIPRMHRQLIELAAPAAGDRILEIGCGTGNLTVLTKRLHPGSEVVGADPDPLALARARRKTEHPELLRFDRAHGQDLPYPDESFDHVLSAFMFHHLDADAKTQTLREIRRVLRPDGALHLVDFGGQVTRKDGLMARLQLRANLLRDNLGDAIPARMRAAGLRDAREVTHISGVVGRATFYRADRGSTD